MANTYGQYMTSMKDITQVSGGGSSGVYLNSDESQDIQEARQMASTRRRNMKEDSTITDLDQNKGVEDAKEALAAEVALIKYTFPSCRRRRNQHRKRPS
jgi:hypothetical protein